MTAPSVPAGDVAKLVEELRRVDIGSGFFASVRSAATALESLSRDLADARAALEPFANYYGPHYPDTDNRGAPLPDEDGVGWVYLTVGDFRRARSVLSTPPKDTPDVA